MSPQQVYNGSLGRQLDNTAIQDASESCDKVSVEVPHCSAPLHSSSVLCWTKHRLGLESALVKACDDHHVSSGITKNEISV